MTHDPQTARAGKSVNSYLASCAPAPQNRPPKCTATDTETPPQQSRPADPPAQDRQRPPSDCRRWPRQADESVPGALMRDAAGCHKARGAGGPQATQATTSPERWIVRCAGKGGGNAACNGARIDSQKGSNAHIVWIRKAVHVLGMVWCLTASRSVGTVQRVPSVVVSKARSRCCSRYHSTSRCSMVVESV
jgi:hypothetical protein